MALSVPEAHALFNVLVGAGVGLAIGLERGWNEINEERHQAAGIRTFTLVGLLGGLAGWMQTTWAIDTIVVAFIGVLTLTAVAHALEVWRGGDVGLTSEFALLIAFLLGATAGLGYWLPAAATAIVVALILGLKTPIHDALRRLNKTELLATLQLLVFVVLIFPLLPDRDVFGVPGLVPRTIGLLTLLVLTLSYAGYFCMQFLGHRKGIVLAALLGGLTSSTAVTMTFARLAKDNKHLASELGAGVGLACAVMAPRLLIVVGLLMPGLIRELAWPLLPLLLSPLLASVWQLWRAQPDTPQMQLALKNPLALKTALAFGAILTVLFAAVPMINTWAGTGGLYTLAGLSGATDVDAIALTLAKSAQDAALGEIQAVRAIVIAAVANTVFKATLAGIVSGGALIITTLALLIGASMSAVLVWVL